MDIKIDNQNFVSFTEGSKTTRLHLNRLVHWYDSTRNAIDYFESNEGDLNFSASDLIEMIADDFGSKNLNQ